MEMIGPSFVVSVGAFFPIPVKTTKRIFENMSQQPIIICSFTEVEIILRKEANNNKKYHEYFINRSGI